MMRFLQFPPSFIPGGTKSLSIYFRRKEEMGSRVMRYTYVFEKEHGRWKEFRKRLSKEDQEAFDRLFDRAKFHTAAGVYMAHPYPLETILVSIILEHEKMLGEILNKLR